MLYKDVPILKPPYFKPRGWMKELAPIPMFGIPKEADSSKNKRVLGTTAHELFWNNEIYKIVNGFNIGAFYIPGDFYYYMNYKWMQTINGVITPDMVDLYLELSYFANWLYTYHRNGLYPKARRKGISEWMQTFMDHKWRFTEAFKGGIAAGKKVYTEDYLNKWRFGDSSLPLELKLKKLVDNDDEIVAGYQIKNSHGVFEDKGTMNAIYARTMHTNPNMFKGIYLNMVTSEEIGEHENWFSFFNATKDALMSNNIQKGVFFGYGTAGNVNKGSKDFKRLSEEAEIHNFVEMPIYAPRKYYYGGASLPENQLPLESELFKTHRPYQLIGVEDVTLAETDILKRRERLLKAGNMKEYNEDLQNNPLNKKEMFRKSVVNNFNTEILNAQAYEIDFANTKKYSRFVLEWELNEEGLRKIPLAVTARPATMQDHEWQCCYIIDTEHPRKGTKAMYTAGIDSYDQDTSRTSKSLGGMEVRIRENRIGGAMRRAPVAIIRNRPPRKEIFYENCLKMAVYYDIIGNVLGDVRTPLIIQFWKQWGCEKYLAGRPAKYESPNSDQGHEFWVSLNNYSKPLMVGAIQTDIEDNGKHYWFPVLVDELQNYDEIEVDSDNDLADAHGLAIMQDHCCEVRPKMLDEEHDKRFDLPDFGVDRNGEMQMVDGSERIKSKDVYGNEEEFDDGRW